MVQPSAVITGAGRGIGRAVSIELGRRGFRVAIAARNEAELLETKRLVLNAAPAGAKSPQNVGDETCLVCPTDVTQSAAIKHLIDNTNRRFGRIDAVVHCAGLAPVRSIAGMSDSDWQAVLDTNLSSAFYLCRAVWPVFERQKSGAVVLVSSAAARDPFTGFAAYGAAKAGLNLFALAAAREGEPSGIRVHVVAPGAVETAMFRQLLTPEQWPTEKTLDPADVARTIVQCIDGDLRHCSGEVIWMKKTIGNG